MSKAQTFEKLKIEIRKRIEKHDPAHDFEHIMRVYRNAEQIAKKEGADMKIVLTAALLHDIVSYKKSDPRSKNSSSESAIEAKKILQRHNYGSNEIKIISDAINEHSFSKGVVPKTLEGKVLQDADRLDAIGSVGIARAFAVGGAEGRSFYNIQDPFCVSRYPDDSKWTIDHFYKKLLLLDKKMNTKTAKIEARRRIKIMKQFLKQLEREI